jgi:hypothetical protein
MVKNNQLNAGFHQIALSDTNGEVIGVTLSTTSNTAGTVTVNAQPNITSVGNLTSLVVDGVSTLGAVGNVKITGGSNAQYLRTDGTGNLSWANTPSSSVLANGTSNVSIPVANGNVSVSVGGIANTVSFANNGTTFNKRIVVPPYESTVSTTISPDMGLRVTDSDFPNNETVITAYSSKVYGILNVVGETQLLGFKETTIGATNTGASIAPDLSTGTIRHYTANANFTFNGFTNPVAGQSATIVITQDATGGRVMTSTMKFVGGNKTLSTAAGAIDLVCVVYTGVHYLACLTKGYA